MEDSTRKTSGAAESIDAAASESSSEVARLKKRHRDLYEASRDGYLRADRDWRILEFNSALARMLGYEREHLLGSNCRALVPQKWRDILSRVFREQVLVRGYSDLFEFEIRRADGSMLRVEAQTYINRDDHGEPDGAWSIIRDATSTRDSKSTGSDREHHFQVLADTAFDWVYWIDPEGRIVHNSLSCLRLTGYPSEDFISDPSRLLAVIHPDDRAAVEAHINSEMTEARDDTLQFRIVRADGEVRWIEHRCTTLYDRNGCLLGRRACNADITHRKTMENALNESLQRFRTLAEYSLMGIAIYNDNGMAFVNQAMADILGYPIGQIRTWNFENLAALIYPKDHDWIVDRFYRRLQGDQSVPSRYQMRLQAGDGVLKWVDLYAARVMLDGVPHILTNMVDVTALVSARAALEKANLRLQEQHAALEEKNTVLHGVLNQIESEKQNLALRIQTNLEQVVLPHLRALRTAAAPLEQVVINQVESAIRDVTSQFIERLTNLGADLAPREIQVCKLISDGLSTKEIAVACNVSVRTVEVWRKRIRKKLGLANRGVNLVSYLRSIKH